MSRTCLSDHFRTGASWAHPAPALGVRVELPTCRPICHYCQPSIFQEGLTCKDLSALPLRNGTLSQIESESVTHQEGEVPATRPVKGIYNGTSFSTNLQTTPGLPACNAVSSASVGT